ncbi:exported hypothetical protein [Nitrospina gracilis 3/211]|uniref:Uncharacterized protein n=1 Tax=Nitrospina gracilis (strain 3/211) TaxID=1266370 RepID=M1YYL4_NITG3|nr:MULTISPECIES: hypothetical protein [Nitrospina]MCF8723703.1 hypothetical protein [Nitrospina sp. Nb-3]CCQ90791.1 exported hypothetical protein [Nitrospina gracilis 3/211]
MRFSIIMTLAAAFLCAGLFANQSVFAAGANRVFVTQVEDTRTTGNHFGRCEVELTVMGPAVPDSAGIYDVKVGYAVDDTGRILISDKGVQRGFFKHNKDRESKLTHDVKLKNPNRSAQFIQILRGHVLLFRPSASNGGQVEVRGFMQKPGEWIQDPALNDSDIRIMYITKETLEKRKAEQKKKMMESEEMEQFGQQLGDAMLKMIEGLFGGMMKDYKNSLNFIVEDPLKRVVDMKFLDAAGKEMDSASRSHFGEVRAYSFKEQPSPATRMVLYLASPDAILKVPFDLKNIALP